MRGTGTGRHGNGARHAQRNQRSASIVRKCVPRCTPCARARAPPPSGVRACVPARALTLLCAYVRRVLYERARVHVCKDPG